MGGSNRRSALYTLCLFEAFPSRGNEGSEEKNRESYISCTIPQFPPLVVNAVSQSPACLSCHMTQKANPVTLTLYLSPPKGETTHYILRVASAPSSTAVTDSLDFQVADAPLQIQFA